MSWGLSIECSERLGGLSSITIGGPHDSLDPSIVQILRVWGGNLNCVLSYGSGGSAGDDPPSTSHLDREQPSNSGIVSEQT
jgi:hypothetical protein